MRNAKEEEFVESLRTLINTLSLENNSNTPDYILAEYLYGCLKVFEATVNKREIYYGRSNNQKHYALE